MKTVVIGLGNPILSDDSVGIKVAREIERFKIQNSKLKINIIEAYAGGLRLMDELIGYDRAIIIDAMVTGNVKPGSFKVLPLSSLVTTRNISCTHDTNILTAIEFGKMLGLKLPDDITIIGIEAKDVETFAEELTDDVHKAVTIVASKIVDEIIYKKGLCSEKCLDN
ncbi:hydrogenase expression/formation protein [Dissulfurispira thermophila]|uniref:Hydrogenase expression/formation protein n=2 Tax=root TaxID=1 RepID=A0A7G1GZ66_9BACT|nr:hydrogenase maturation protease [Dissulfurispira thermophila]BCB95203.1 hydrogenase expression/formation protein [Dissulfurispira thermophila]